MEVFIEKVKMRIYFIIVLCYIVIFLEDLCILGFVFLFICLVNVDCGIFLYEVL